MAHPDETFGAGYHEDKSRRTDKTLGKAASGSPSAQPKRHRQKGDINPKSEIDMERLRESMRWSAKKFNPFVERHIDAVRYFAGSRYGAQTDLDRTPMNLMRLAVDVWLRQLAAQTPRTLILTRMPDLRTDAYEMEIAVDHLLSEINFGYSLSETVRSALFSMGVMKVGLTGKYLAEASGFTSDAGQPYADPVLLEQWLHDMNARRPEEWDWCGNKYKLPYDVVMQHPDYDKKVKDRIRPEEESELGDEFIDGHKSTTQMSTGEGLYHTEYRQHVDLWDLWIPSEGLLVTVPAQEGLMPLQVREWEGPEHGPYHILGFSHVPGNLMPSAPAQHLVDLQDLITRLFNQLGRQAERQKTVTIADGRADADGTAEAIMEAEDGQVIKANHVDSVKEMKYGGVEQGNMAFVVWLREIFSYLGGNIDAMGGLAQQAGTLGQEQLLVQSSSEMVRDMQSKVVTYTEEVIKDLAWYMWTDPFIELPLTKRIEGFGDIPFTWSPGEQEQEFFEYNFQIQPYSLQHKSPTQRLQQLLSYTTQVFIPMAPQLEQWGQTLRFDKLVELLAKYSDLPEIQELIQSANPTQAELVGGGMSQSQQRTLQSPTTNRNYTRENVSAGGTQQSRDRDMVGQLMAAASQGGKSGG